MKGTQLLPQSSFCSGQLSSFHHRLCLVSAQSAALPAAAFKSCLRRVLVLLHYPRATVPAHSAAKSIQPQAAAPSLPASARCRLSSSLAGCCPCSVVGGCHSDSNKSGSKKHPSSTVPCLQLWPRVEVQWEKALETGLTQIDLFPRTTSGFQQPALKVFLHCRLHHNYYV